MNASIWSGSTGGSGRFTLNHAIAVYMAAAGFWVLFVALASTSAILVGGYSYQPQNLGWDAALVLQGALFSVLIRALLERLTGQPFWGQLMITALVLIACAPVFEAGFRALNAVVRDSGPPDFTPVKVLGGAVFWLAPLGLWAAVNLALLHDAEARRRERRLAEARVQAQEAQILALRYQVNPHFLYNALNSIATLILDRRVDLAEEMVLRLSEFLRAGLANDPLADVRLVEELALQRLYLAVEEVRLGDMFVVEIDVPVTIEDARVPSLILQPLVENSVKHALRGPGFVTTLRISARRADQRLILEVCDDGIGAAAGLGGAGVGLGNVERRIAARFGSAGSFEASGDAGGFTARITLPLVFA